MGEADAAARCAPHDVYLISELEANELRHQNKWQFADFGLSAVCLLTSIIFSSYSACATSTHTMHNQGAK